ncbi:MAG TPA: ice-binding family protein [Gammaproteobacteria bacterium]|nr:ice-binding family protein [Gammaproteobacteria bacterium]
MKHLSKLALLAVVLVWMGIARADEGLVVVKQLNDIQDMACVIPESQDHTVVMRMINYRINNHGQTPAELALTLSNHDSFPDSTVAIHKIDCGAVFDGNYAAATLAPGAQCGVSLLVRPPECPANVYGEYQPVLGDIHRVFQVVTNAGGHVVLPIDAQISALGAAAAFGILSPALHNEDALGPVKVHHGDVGSLATMGSVLVTDGEHHQDGAYPTLVALQDLQSASRVFRSNQGCSNLDYDLSNAALPPGVYCLNGHSVSNHSTLTLNGEGIYVFYVDYEGFYLGQYAKVLLDKGAHADNVYWIVDNRLHLELESTIVGNILVARSVPYQHFGDLSKIKGRVLSLDTLSLYGNRVMVPQN